MKEHADFSDIELLNESLKRMAKFAAARLEAAEFVGELSEAYLRLVASRTASRLPARGRPATKDN